MAQLLHTCPRHARSQPFSGQTGSCWNHQLRTRRHKGGGPIEDMFKQLLPHGKPDCVTHLQKDETIDEAINRIATSEGMYKMYWMLSQKAQNANQGTDHKETLIKKAQTAVDKAMNLLAMELNLEKSSLDFTVANAVVKQKTRAAMQSEVRTEELRKIGNLPPFPQTQGGESKEDAEKKMLGF